MDKEYLSPEEVAAALSVSRRTVYAWIKAGKIPAKRFGGVWRVHKDVLNPPKEKAA